MSGRRGVDQTGLARRLPALLRITVAVALLGCLVLAPSGTSAPAGLVAAYAFEEDSGTTVADASGNGLTGTLTNGPTWVAGKYGGAVGFDGSDDYVSLGNPSQLQLTGSMTISAWIYSAAFPGDDAAIVSKRANGEVGFQLDTTIDRGPRTIGFKLTNSSGGQMFRYGATAMQTNTWYHVAGVYNAAAGTLDVYLNGQLDNGPLQGTVTASQQNSSLAVNIGRRASGGFLHNGRIDDVRIYSTALTQAEIQADMTTAINSVPDTQAPTLPGTLSATAVSAGRVDLSWGAAGDNVGVGGYRIERCQGAGCSNFSQIAAPTGTGTTYSDTTVTAGTSYGYRIRAVDAAGNLGPYGNTATVTTPAPDTSPPTVPGTLSATAVSAGRIDLSWAAASDNVGVTGYRVERCQGSGCSGFAQIAVPAGTGTTYSDTTVAAGTSFSYRVRATDAAGNLGPYGNAASATTPTPSGPTPVAAYAFEEGSGTSVADASGNGLTGTLTNGPTWVAGKYGGAVGFDGSNDYVSLGNPTQLQLTGSMTISAWIYSAAFPGDDAAIVSKRNGGESGFQLDTTIDRGPRTIGFKLTNSSGGQMFRYGATAMQTNTWYHVAGVYNATAGTLDVYLNGQLDNGPFEGTVTSSQQNSSLAVNIGRRASGGFLHNGRIDDVRIYNTALTQAQIQADMVTPVAGGQGADHTPPTVAITSPAANAQVSDIVNVTANASDDTGVAGVQFRVDGLASGLEDTAPPYGLSWDTRAVANGAHTLTRGCS